MSHAIAGARGRVGDRDSVLRKAHAWAAERSCEVLLADASAVFGRDHLESAALHAERARHAGLTATRSVSMEALLYLAGERQVADAIRAAGIKDANLAVAIAVFGEGAIDDLISHLGWSRDDGVLDARGKDLARIGFREIETGTVTDDRVADLALERTALLDVLK